MDKLIFNLQTTKPVDISSIIKKVRVSPGEIEVGHFEFYNSDYILKFNLELLDDNEVLLAKATGFSDHSIIDILRKAEHDINEVDWTFLINGIETNKGNKNIELKEIQVVKVSLTPEQRLSLLEIIKPIEKIEDKFYKTKDKIKGKIDSLKDKHKDEIDCLLDKTKETVHKIQDKVKNKDFSKKEAAALGAGAVILLATLFKKK